MSEHGVAVQGVVTLHWDNEHGDWVLHAPIRVDWGIYHFTVFGGFHTDLSSIPRIARSLIPQVGRQNRAAICHDWAYEDGVPGMTRREADKMFLEIMKLDGVNWLRRTAMYTAVRVGGHGAWGKD